MRSQIVLTLTGADRIGLVEEVTRRLLDIEVNVETSRMARLGGVFAILLLVSLPTSRLPQLDDVLAALRSEGFAVQSNRTADAAVRARAGYLPYQIEVVGADDEGIIHRIAQELARRGINIETLDTSTSPAPMTGATLFSMSALVVAPRTLDGAWRSELEAIGGRMNVDVIVKRIA
ncbi:MAG: transcriptional regulator [Chloroflexi bacterium]|nr:transcriptional regulator [Chloroflexota bacterium]